jgi:hypothetical protein
MTQGTGYTGQSGTTGSNQVGNGLAIAGLVCGLIGLFLYPIVFGPLAIVFGGVGLAKANRGAGHKGMSIAAIVLGVIDLLLIVVLAVALNN